MTAKDLLLHSARPKKPPVEAAKTLLMTADGKGRVALGPLFANHKVVLEVLSKTEILVRVIPQREAWLYENPTALAAVRKGLAQARSRRGLSRKPQIPD